MHGSPNTTHRPTDMYGSSSSLKTPTSPQEEDKGEGQVYGNVFAELESVDLPLGTSLR